MKNYLLVFALLLSSFVGFGQEAPAPFKGANVIHVMLPDSAGVAWRKAAQTITARGFAIKASDNQLLTITTEPKQLSANLGVSISCQVNGKVASLRGSFSNKLLEVQATPITYTGRSSGTFATTWQQIQTIANALGGTLTYGKE